MMNNNGLYIKEFEARGENVSTSKLTFQKGCNVVLGKSDTGKTTLYSIIEFVLGKGSIDLTLPPEGDGYTDFLLEIHTYVYIEEKHKFNVCICFSMFVK